MRVDPPLRSNELDTLSAFLDYQRATLAMKCEGLDEDSLREAAVAPSKLSLLGLVRHLTDVERGWFRICLAGEDIAPLYSSETDRDGDFDNLADVPAEAAIQRWREECEISRGVLASFGSLDEASREPGAEPVSVRWVLVHMIEEYARHNGHADFLRERLDGATGE